MDGFIGLLSNTISTFIVHPIDVVKTRYQIATVKKHNIPTSQIVSDIYKTNGIKGYYRGLGPQLITYPFFWAIYFQTSGMVNICDKSFLCNMGVTFGAASLASTITNPLFVLKTRMQTAETKPRIMKVAKELYKENGMKSAFKGLRASLINNAKLGFQFPLYDVLRDTTGSMLFSSMASKLISSTIFYPLDLIRVNQRNMAMTTDIQYVAVSILKNHGLRGLYKGALLYNMVSTPNFVLMILIREKLEKSLKTY